MKSIRNSILSARRSAGMTQAILAEAVDVSTNYISLIENGHRQPSLGFLQCVATATAYEFSVTFVASPD